MPLCDCISIGRPKVVKILSKSVTMALANMFLSGMDSGYRVVGSMKMRRYLLPFFVLSRGSTQSMIILENGYEGIGIRFKGA